MAGKAGFTHNFKVAATAYTKIHLNSNFKREDVKIAATDNAYITAKIKAIKYANITANRTATATGVNVAVTKNTHIMAPKEETMQLT